MPFFRIGAKLAYFAHVPKCGGTSVEDYLVERFGPLAMLDRRFQHRPPAARWSRTSPQHIDWESLQSILPLGFIDAVFTVVRHPIARAESAYHFQVGVEKSIPADTPFSDWLRAQIALLQADRFALDNHMRPQSDFVPEGAAVFPLEHGLDAIVPYLDALAGTAEGPRAIGHSNRRKPAGPRVAPPAWAKPSGADVALLREIFAADFARFGYRAESREPPGAKPALAASFLAARDRELARRARLSYQLARKLRRWLGRP